MARPTGFEPVTYGLEGRTDSYTNHTVTRISLSPRGQLASTQAAHYKGFNIKGKVVLIEKSVKHFAAFAD